MYHIYSVSKELISLWPSKFPRLIEDTSEVKFYNNCVISQALIGRNHWSIGVQTIKTTWWWSSLFSLFSLHFAVKQLAWGSWVLNILTSFLWSIRVQSMENCSNLIIGIWNVGFWGKEKTGVAGENPLGARERTNSKFNPLLALMQLPPCPNMKKPSKFV